MKILLTILLVFITIPAWASSVYYIRNDGGTNVQCNGKTDHALAGASGTNCALASLSWLQVTNYNTTAQMVAGDTVIFDNIDENVGSGQAKYVTGYTMPNIAGPNCSPSAASSSCTIDAIPGGVDAAHPTRILGKGYGSCTSTATNTKAQLWGQGGASVLNFNNGTFDIECLEITDHSSCIQSGPVDGTVNGDPVHCATGGNGATEGDWSPNGLVFSSALGVQSLIIKDVDIHGMAARPLYAFRIQNATVTNSNFIANGYVGWDSDLNNGCTSATAGDGTFTIPAACSAHNNTHGTIDCDTNHDNPNADQTCASCTADTGNNCYWRRDDYTGKVTLDTVKIQFNGCGEKYPRTDYNWDTTTDIHHCWNDTQGGYGDGIGLGDGPSGAWIIKNSSVSWNTSDGIDLLHSNQGTLTVERTRAEGNDGQQLKTSVATTHLENSLIVGNCGFFKGQTFTSTKDVSGNSVGMNICRANSDTIAFSNGNGGQKFYIDNTTILSNGDSAIISSGSGCDSGTVLRMRNSIVREGAQFSDDPAGSCSGGCGNDTAGFYYASGSDGNGAGTCGSLKIDEDYDIIYGAKATTGSCGDSSNAIYGGHSDCSHNPVFATTPPMGPTTYITNTNPVTDFYIQTSSPAKNFADTTISTLQDGSADYNSFARGASWDSGGFEYGTSSSTCTSNNVSCSVNSDCCSNICSAGLCSSGNCAANAAACTVNGDCCSGICCSGTCSITSCASPAAPSNKLFIGGCSLKGLKVN